MSDKEMEEDEQDVNEEVEEEDENLDDDQEEGLASDEELLSEGEKDEDFFVETEPVQTKLQRSQSFEVIKYDNIINNSKNLIDSVVSVCGIPHAAMAAALLRHFKWNKDKLIEAYMDNPEKTLQNSGLASFELEKPIENANAVHSCLICLEDLPATQTFALACGHRYCKDCWKGYLEVKIKDGPSCVHARCPAPKCKAIVHEQAYKKLVTNQQFDRFNTFLLRSFVDDNTQIKWCPFPGCTNAVKCERTGRKQPVTCSCGFVFCFRCADSDVGDHNPVTCEHLEKWFQKASDESENVKWVIANTKKCPKCRSPIEKNGGCMHMTCRLASCGFEFCWLCRGPWTEHGSATGGYYQCNKYDASEAKREDDTAASIKTELETYMFYFHRYESHKGAGKIADQQRKTCQKREQQILDKFDVRSQDTKFLSEAAEQLIACRRVLQFSYVMGYYLDKSKAAEKNLFEYLQEDLEKHTNHLSELYEMTLENIKDYHAFMQWKENVTNYTRVTKKFLDNFLEGTSEGLTFVS